MALSVPATKLLTALIIFLCGFVSTITPLFVAGSNEALFSAGNMMACGVLLAAGLVHQLADSAAALQDWEFPWSFFICGLTFILFLISEESVHCLVAAGDHHDHGRKPAVVEIHDHDGHLCRGSLVVSSVEEVLESETNYGTSNEHEPLKLNRTSSQSKSMRQSTFTGKNQPQRASRLSVRVFGEPKEKLHHHDGEHISEHLHGSLLASVMLLMALCIHSVLAGLSIGFVQNVKEIYSTAVAIVAHKVFAGYALGSTMVAADLGYDRILTLGTCFASSTPIGILIGMGLNSYNDDSSSVGIVQAIVAGTFLYVSIMEVGMKELLISRHDDGPLRLSLSDKQMEALKLCSMLVGFLGMSYLAEFV